MLDTVPQASKRSASEIDVHVGQRLRERRMVIGMSQEALAGLLNLTFQQVQKYERGMNRVNAGRLFEMARILDVPITYFYEGLGADMKPSAPSPVTELLATREGVELAQAFAAIEDPKQRSALIQVARSMSAV